MLIVKENFGRIIVSTGFQYGIPKPEINVIISIILTLLYVSLYLILNNKLKKILSKKSKFVFKNNNNFIETFLGILFTVLFVLLIIKGIFHIYILFLYLLCSICINYFKLFREKNVIGILLDFFFSFPLIIFIVIFLRINYIPTFYVFLFIFFSQYIMPISISNVERSKRIVYLIIFLGVITACFVSFPLFKNILVEENINNFNSEQLFTLFNTYFIVILTSILLLCQTQEVKITKKKLFVLEKRLKKLENYIKK